MLACCQAVRPFFASASAYLVKISLYPKGQLVFAFYMCTLNCDHVHLKGVCCWIGIGVLAYAGESSSHID